MTFRLVLLVLAVPLLYVLDPHVSYAAAWSSEETLQRGSVGTSSRRSLTEADFEEQNISTFREQDGRQKERKAAFERAVLKASAPSSAGRGIVLVVVVDHKAARFHLPLFLATLRGAGGLDASLVVTNLNQAAQEICSRVHTPALCVEEALPSAINGFDTDEAIEYGQLKSGHLFLGWLKGFVGQRVIELGHKTLLLDTDIVFFSNPIADFLKTKADLIISSDCDNLYHPKHSRNLGVANLGMAYFDSGARASKLMKLWLSLAAPFTADQIGLKDAMESSVDEDSELLIELLPKDIYPNFCCGYCDSFLGALTLHKANWHLSCPMETTKDWIFFHVACTGENRGFTGHHDSLLEKRHLMQAVWEMVMWQRNGSLFTYEIT